MPLSRTTLRGKVVIKQPLRQLEITAFFVQYSTSTSICILFPLCDIVLLSIAPRVRVIAREQQGIIDLHKYTRSIRSIYSSKSLAEIAKRAKHRARSTIGDREFSDFQRQIIQAHLPLFHFDFLATSLIVCDSAFMPVETDVVCLNIDDALAEGYANVAHFDEVSPLCYINSGRAVSTENMRTIDEWHNHPVYEHHCKFFDIEKMITISFRSREFLTKHLAFEYLASSDHTTWNIFDHHLLELASFPFALAWYFRKGLMDEATLTRRFLALSDLTEAKLTHLRMYVNSPDLTFLEQATELKISEAWLKENLYEIRNRLAPRMKWDVTKRKVPSSLRLLEREFQFMDMLGDPTRFINPFEKPPIP